MFGAVLRCGLVDLVLGCLFLVFPSSFGGVVGDGGVRRRSGFVLYFTLRYNPIPIAKKKTNPAVPFQKALWLLFAGQNEKEDGIIRRLVLAMSPKRSVILSQESGRAEHREWDD